MRHVKGSKTTFVYALDRGINLEGSSVCSCTSGIHSSRHGPYRQEKNMREKSWHNSGTLGGWKTYLVSIQQKVAFRLPERTGRERMHDRVPRRMHSDTSLIRPQNPTWPITREKHARECLFWCRRRNERDEQPLYFLQFREDGLLLGLFVRVLDVERSRQDFHELHGENRGSRGRLRVACGRFERHRLVDG